MSSGQRNDRNNIAKQTENWMKPEIVYLLCENMAVNVVSFPSKSRAQNKSDSLLDHPCLPLSFSSHFLKWNTNVNVYALIIIHTNYRESSHQMIISNKLISCLNCIEMLRTNWTKCFQTEKRRQFASSYCSTNFFIIWEQLVLSFTTNN